MHGIEQGSCQSPVMPDGVENRIKSGGFDGLMNGRRHRPDEASSGWWSRSSLLGERSEHGCADGDQIGQRREAGRVAAVPWRNKNRRPRVNF